MMFSCLCVDVLQIFAFFAREIDDVKNLNWCKFIVGFLHDALSNKMYEKGCRLHLMLIYVEQLDLSTVDLIGVGGLPLPPHKFVATTHVEHLVGHFASGMTSLLRKLVQGWRALAGSDADEVVRHFTSFVGAHTHRTTSCRGLYDHNSSQEHLDTQENSFVGGLGEMDAGPAKGPDGHDVTGNVQNVSDQRRPVAEQLNRNVPTPSRASSQLKKGVPTAVGISYTRLSPRASLSNTGDPVVLEDMRKQSKATNKDPLERIHSTLETSGNVDIHVPLVNKPAAPAPNAATSSHGSKRSFVSAIEVNTTSGAIGISDARLSGSDESVCARTAEVVPTLLSMSDATTIPSGRSASDEVSAPKLIFNKEDSGSSSTDSTRGAAGTAMPTKEGVAAKIPEQRTSTNEFCHIVPTTAPIAQATPAKVSRAGLPPWRSPRKNPTKASTAVEVVKSRPGTNFVRASSLFPPFEQSNSALMTHTAPNLKLQTSKIPANVGVPYSPNKKIGKKDVIEITDSSPRPTNKTDSRVTFDREMFVQLSPLDSANQFMWNPSKPHERHPMDFTPPSYSLGIDRTQDEPPIDPEPVAFAFSAGMAPMMAQPILDGWKVVKFAQPIVQGKQHARVVHARVVVDCQPEKRATREETLLYDIVKRFGNARASNQYKN
ncbi:hypothetical protein ZWY2020_007699 [Hordeum vulgare]|nr:hypothetical protein ZWY2020_007699 [Hordeum vulgare]